MNVGETKPGFLEDQGKNADPVVMAALVAARKLVKGQTRGPRLPPQLSNRSNPTSPASGSQDTDPEVRPSDPAVEDDVEDRLSQQDQQTRFSPNTEGMTAAFENMMIPFEQLKYIDDLGSGGYGKVYKMTWLQHSEVAVKVLLADGASVEFMREMSLLASLHHPNILQLYGVTRGSFSDNGPLQWMMVCEFMASGSLHTHLHKDRAKVISWGQKLQILVEVAKGMSFLHSDLPAKSRIAHLDLKPDNVLLGKMTVKVADFGVSKGGQHTVGTAAAGEIGTYEYMGPEFVLGTGVGTASDVYSFGIMMWEVETRTLVLNGMLEAVGRKSQYPNRDRMLLPIWVAENGLRPRLPATESRNCPSGWAELMKACWTAKPGERPKFPEVVRALQSMLAAAVVASRATKKIAAQEAKKQAEIATQKTAAAETAKKNAAEPTAATSTAPAAKAAEMDKKTGTPGGISSRVWQAILAIFAKLYQALRCLWLRPRVLLFGPRQTQ